MGELQKSPSDVRLGVLRRMVPDRSARARVHLSIIMAVRPDFKVKAVIENLSKDGVRIKSRVLLYAGQVIELEMPRETFACQVRWVSGFEAGGILVRDPSLADAQ